MENEITTTIIEKRTLRFKRWEYKGKKRKKYLYYFFLFTRTNRGYQQNKNYDVQNCQHSPAEIVMCFLWIFFIDN